MLEALRSGASSWVAKGLLGLLVISFAVWGIGSDFISGFSSQSVVEVGRTEVSPYEFERAYRRELDNLRARFGGSIDQETANSLGLMDITVERLVQSAVIDETTRELGLTVPDEVVRERIVADPAFRGIGGQFDENTFRQRLYQAGLNEQYFVEETRRNISREFLINSVIAGVDEAPDAIVTPINNYREERRVAEFFEVMNGSVVEVPEATDNDLQTFYDENIGRYTKPEYRAVTAVHLAPRQLAATVAVPEDEVEKTYEARIDRYHTPARRELEQLVFADQESAKAAHERLKGGATMAEVGADMLGLTATDISLGEVVKADLPADVADAVFTLGADTISDPMESALGWHIFKVKATTEESTKPLSEVGESIRMEIALAKASEELYQLTGNLEDELAGGATLEEAAAKINVPTLKIEAVDRNGLGPDGKAVPDVPEAREFLRVAFETPDGEQSFLTETRNNAFFILRVDRTIPSAPQPLAEIRDTVLSDWQAAQRRKIAGERARSLAGEISAGKNIAALAEAEGMDVVRSEPFTRTGTDAAEDLSTAAIAALFEARPGSAIAAPNAADTGHVVARLALIQQAGATEDSTARNRHAQELARDIAGDLLEITQQALREQVGVSVNRQALEQFRN